MKFLVDECLSPAAARALADAGHDALHVTDVGLNGHPDDAVMGRLTPMGE